MARTYRGTPRNLAFLAARLRRGELVAVPTETVYGLAADATRADACRAIFTAKGRPQTDPLIVHIAGVGDLGKVAVPSPAALRLARAFWPGPLTLVLPKTALIPDEATAGLPSVAVRLPAHPLFRRLIRLAGVPLAAPSANLFGYVSPTGVEHVREGLGRRIAHILDGGPSAIGLESTIVDLRNPDRPALLRPGAVTREEIERVLGRKLGAGRRAGSARAQVAPGQLTRHYSPRTKVVLHTRLSRATALRGGPRDAWLFLARPAGTAEHPLPPNIFWLDQAGDLRRAARGLFGMLRRLDRGAFETIHVEVPSGGGLAEAMRDRLGRAAAK
jgi:L-threonylcarbamoyladenylate synthase